MPLAQCHNEAPRRNQVVRGNARALTESGCFDSGDVKGTVRNVVWCLPVSIDVRRHGLISISCISLLPCHSNGQMAQKRRRRHERELKGTGSRIIRMNILLSGGTSDFQRKRLKQGFYFRSLGNRVIHLSHSSHAPQKTSFFQFRYRDAASLIKNTQRLLT
jgi:hypothetical protein